MYHYNQCEIGTCTSAIQISLKKAKKVLQSRLISDQGRNEFMVLNEQKLARPSPKATYSFDRYYQIQKYAVPCTGTCAYLYRHKLLCALYRSFSIARSTGNLVSQ